MTEPLAVDIKNLTLNLGGSCCLDIPSFSVKQGESIMLFGGNSSGKTTLMKILSGIIRPQRGSVCVLGRDLIAMNKNELSQFRADHVGHIFQNLNLLPYLTALENLVLPCGFSGLKASYASSDGLSPEYEAYMLLAKLKFEDPKRLRVQAGKLSKGLQQRIAVVRALIGKPALILADEPDSAMGSYSKKLVYELLTERARAHNSTLICISHNKDADQYFDRRINMKNINTVAELNPLW